MTQKEIDDFKELIRCDVRQEVKDSLKVAKLISTFIQVAIVALIGSIIYMAILVGSIKSETERNTTDIKLLKESTPEMKQFIRVVQSFDIQIRLLKAKNDNDQVSFNTINKEFEEWRKVIIEEKYDLRTRGN